MFGASCPIKFKCTLKNVSFQSQRFTQWGNTGSIPSEVRGKKGCSLLPLLFETSLEELTNPIKQKKEISFVRIGKEEEIKAFLFTNIIVLYLKTQKSNKKLLQTFKKVQYVSKIIKLSIKILLIYANSFQLEDTKEKTLILKSNQKV